MSTKTKTSASPRSTKELGQFIREYRKSKNLTIEAVSGLANVSQRFLSELERGKETAEIGKVLKVLQTLGLDVSIQTRTSTPVIAQEKNND